MCETENSKLLRTWKKKHCLIESKALSMLHVAYEKKEVHLSAQCRENYLNLDPRNQSSLFTKTFVWPSIHVSSKHNKTRPVEVLQSVDTCLLILRVQESQLRHAVTRRHAKSTQQRVEIQNCSEQALFSGRNPAEKASWVREKKATSTTQLAETITPLSRRSG
jgi:hypothetical protein